MNLPLLFFASILPDIDLALQFVMHRGPTHSLIVITALSIPFLAVYQKRMIPYYVVFVTHVLIGDFITGGSQMLWPLSENSYGFRYFNVKSDMDAIIEVALFLVMLAFMVKTKDLRAFLEPGIFNLSLIVPFVATLGPLLQTARAVRLGLEFALPLLLVVPSLFFLVLFAIAFLVELRFLVRSDKSSKE